VAKKLVVEIVGDSSSLEKAFKSSASASNSLGKTFVSLGKVAALAGAAIGVAAVVGIKKSVEAASSLEESINAVNVVFGKASKQVLAFGRGAAQEVGLSMRQLNELVTPIGASLLNVGYSADEAAKASIDLTKRAADMASVFNTTVPEALQAIQSGLRGEADPLEKFGVGLTAVAVNAEAMSLGLAKSEKALTAQDKAQARVNLLMKQTQRLQGDFKNTSDSLANAQRIIGAEWENISASLGAKFLPVVARAASGVATFLGEFDKAQGASAKLDVIWQTVQGTGQKLIEALRKAVAGIDWVAVWAAATGMAAGFGAQLQTQLGDVDWTAVGDRIINGLVAAMQGTAELAKAFADTVTQSFNQIPWDQLGATMAPGLITLVGTAITLALDPSFWIKHWELALSIALVAFGGAIGKFVGKAATVALGPLRNLGDDLIGFLATAINNALPKLGPIIIGGISIAINLTLRALGGLWGKIDDLIAKLAGRLGPLLSNILKVGFVLAGVNAIEGLLSGLSQKIGQVLSWIQGLRPRIVGAFGDAGSWLYAAGAAILQGLWDGLKSKWDAVAGWLGGLGGQIRALKGPPGKDAVLLHDIGQLIMGGLENGMKIGWGKIEQLLEGLSPKMKEKVGGVVDAMTQAVTDKQGAFTSAFDALVSNALSAFDKITSEFETKTEKALRKQDERAAAQALKQAKTDAERGLAEAQLAFSIIPVTDTAALGKATQDILAAQEALRIAEEAITRVRLEKKAAQERKAENERRERERVAFETQARNLETAWNNQEISTAEFHKRMIALFKKFEIPVGKAAQRLGASIAKGLNDSLADVEAAAEAVASAIEKRMNRIKVIVTIGVHGSDDGGDQHRQHGGPVRAGSPYIVGEAGPELFVPSSSGTIHTAGATARMAGGGPTIVQLNFHGPTVGTSRDFEDTVRRALYDISRRNPGTGLALA
jgi:hypothetical protein